jgi:hypothetical protein
MRQAIATAPRHGSAIILEDDAHGTYDVAHWSAEAGEWVRENGEPSKITPSHWYPIPRDKYLPLERDGSSTPSDAGPSASRARRYATSSIAATLVAAALVGMYFRAEVAAYVTRYAGLQDIFRGSTIVEQVVAQETPLPSQDSQNADSLALQQQAEADQQAAQVKQAVEASAPEARKSLEQDRRAEALANELAEARRAINMLNPQLRAEAAKTAQLLGQEREKTAALAQEATAARQELTASAVQHRRALEAERARGAALASELAMARREIETNVALLNKARDDAAQFKQTAESKTAELPQERDRAEALSREVAMARESARRSMNGRGTLERAANNQIAQVTQAVEAAAPERPAAAEAQGNPEATRLIARARALLGQGNIAAARIVLERAAEMGSAQASFTLAESYDPVILSTWGTHGTRGDATTARELYTKAHAGGIQEAKDRFNALRQ